MAPLADLWGSPPPRGTLTVTVRGAEFDADFVEGVPSTYCVLWILEPTRRRRRRTVIAPRTMRPEWQETFALEDTSADATAVIDVWRERQGGGEGEGDEYFGKVTLRVAELRDVAGTAWHELVQGQIELSAVWLEDESPDDAESDDALAPSSHVPVPQKRAEPAPALAPKEVLKPAPAAPAPVAKPSSVPAIPQGSRAAVDSAVVKGGDDEEDEVASYEDEEFEDEPVPPANRAPSALAAHRPRDEELPEPRPSVAGGQQPSRRVEFFEYTHRGGDGTGGKENQDTYFSLQHDERNFLWAVFDGHGHDNGRIAAEAARDTFRAHFKVRANFDALRTRPQEAMDAAFGLANEAVRAAILAQPGVFLKVGHIVVQMEVDEFCPLGYDVVDGGTTATLAALIDGRTLVIAAVGDSCGVLGSCSAGKVQARELVPEHSALSKAEFELVGDGGLQFVYEYPNMYEEGHLPVWERNSRGEAVLSQESIRRVDSYGLGFKTERGDRAAFLLTPEDENFSQMSLAVTRSLGDFYHQQFGVVHTPEVLVLDLAGQQPASPADGEAGGCVLIIASDGVWDHWTFEGAMQLLIEPQTGLTDEARTVAMMEQTREKGAEVFGATADNLTGIVVVLPRV